MIWNKENITESLKEFASTLKYLPQELTQKYFNQCQMLTYALPATSTSAQKQSAKSTISVTQEAIDKFEKVMDWFKILDPQECRLILERAAKKGWKTIASEHGHNRITLWYKWGVAITKLITYLNTKDQSNQNQQ